MLIQAAAHGIGAAIGRPMLIARELENRTLVRVFDQQVTAPERWCLITTAASRQRPEVQAFREWVLEEARTAAEGATGISGSTGTSATGQSRRTTLPSVLPQPACTS